MVNRKRNPRSKAKITTKSEKSPVEENELGNAMVTKISSSFNEPIDCRNNVVQDTYQTDAAHLKVLNKDPLTFEQNTDQNVKKDTNSVLLSCFSAEIIAETNVFNKQNDAAPIQPASSTKEMGMSLQSDATSIGPKKLLHCHKEFPYDQPIQNTNNVPVKNNETYASYQNIDKMSSLTTKNETSSQDISQHKSCQDDITIGGSSSCLRSLKTSKNDPAQNTSPVMLQANTTINNRPKTPDNPIPAHEMFSPNTVNEIRSTIRALFPNGPPPPPPIIPVKRYKKGDTPYIVGSTKRKRVPESNTLNVFKGDDYGITSKTNALDDDEECTPKKRGRRTCNGNWSKSLFNPKSEEIAARLKLNQRVDELLRKSPNKETASFMSKAYSSRPQAFSPLPSTSKDSETILKNEKHFNESLNYDANNYDICDDEELPDILWSLKGKQKKKKHVSLFRNKNLETISKPLIIHEDMNNNNDADFQEIDFCGILSNKQRPKSEDFVTPVNRSMSPIVIDETIVDLENVEDLEPINKTNNNNNESLKIMDTIEINDGYSEITYEDPVPKVEEGDIDKIIAELDAFKKKKGKNMNKSIVTVVDPVTLVECHSQKKVNTVDLVTQSLNETKTQGTLNGFSNSATVIEIPDTVEPVLDVSNYVSASKANPTCSWNEDVEFVSETSSGRVMNSGTRINELGLQNNENITAGSNGDIEIIQNDFANGRNDMRNRRNSSEFNVMDDLQMLFMFLTDSCSKYMEPKRRKRKSNTPKKPSPNKLPTLVQNVADVNNENAAPSMNQQTTTANGEQKLGDCPICMDSLSKNSIASTICGHVFCVECIRKCLNTSGKQCPTCRKQLRGTGYHQVFL